MTRSERHVEPIAEERFDATPWLHLRGQFTYHAEASIAGTVAGLTALRDGIDTAIAAGVGNTDAFASDGEGYAITINRSSTVAGIGRPTYLDQEARELAVHEREYLVRESKMMSAQTKEAFEALRWCRANGNPHVVSANPSVGDDDKEVGGG